MKTESSTGENLSIALLHYPVYDRNQRQVVSAVTNLDLHDISRAARTYGLRKYYVITPLSEQKILVEQIARHWQEGWGATYNPKRKKALDLLTCVDSLDDARKDVEKELGVSVKIIATGAKGRPNCITFGEMKRLLQDHSQPYLLLFGTGWGLTNEVLSGADYILAPIEGKGAYNHLSVRSAVSITLDRLLGEYN